MTKIYLLTNIVIVSAIIVICAIPYCNGVISDKRLCYDPECSEPISLARTLIRYNSIEPHILSFPSNAEVTIFSKEAGRRKDLWGAKVHGKRGYVPKTLVREYRKLKSNLEYEVPTEIGENEVNTTDKVEVNAPSQPDTPKSVEEVVEVNSTHNTSQNSNDVENVETEVNNTITNESKTSEVPEDRELETGSDDPSSDGNPSDSVAKESAQENVEKILEGVQSVTPSYEVVDGTTISFLADEVPIKPSYSTPIVTATATPDEEPILSVHPKLPSTIRPLISRFSSSDSQPIAEDNLQTESNVIAENQTGETDTEKESVPVQHSQDDSESDKSDIVRESNVESDPENEIHSKTSLGGDTKTSDIAQPAENSTKEGKTITNNVETDEDSKLEASESSDDTPVDTSSNEGGFFPAVKAAGSFVRDTLRDVLDGVKNITDDLENVVVTASADETDKDVLHTDLDSKSIHQEEPKSDNDAAENVHNEGKLEGTIAEVELQDSKEQTAHLPDEKIIDTKNGVDGSDNVGEQTVMKETEIPLSSQTVSQLDNQVIENDDIKEHNENFVIHNADEVRVETKTEDGSENDSYEETGENDNLLTNLNSGSEEVTTQMYSNLDEEKPTTTRSLLTVQDDLQSDDNQSSIEIFDIDEPYNSETRSSQEYENETNNEADVSIETPQLKISEQSIEIISVTEDLNIQVAPAEVCDINSDCADLDNNETRQNEEQKAEEKQEEDERSYSSVFEEHNYLETLLYLSITALTTLLFSLGYYYIENQRRDKELVAKINILEKELLVTTKESMMLNEGLKATKHKLDSIEDESFGSNEMVLSLKSELEVAQITKGELEDQIVTLEKELESATEAGLELERMLREFLASQSDENPLAQSVEDLQTRLNAQQATNESLTNNLNLKSQENEALTTELALTQGRCQQLEVEITRLSGELKTQIASKNHTENELSVKIAQLNKQINKLSEERAGLITQLTTKEMALNDLAEVIKEKTTDKLDFEKFYDVSHSKAEAQLVTKERDELRIKLTEVEGAHQLLEEHMKLIKEEIASVTEQYELAERDKTEAQTRLEVLSNYFKEKESQLQKELGMQEAIWVQKQGEVTSTVDRIQTMQNEIQNYRQQIETLKREILDQEREYKSQIAALETKSHEQWVIARQSERRLEESKAEASQLRNRLTMVEKSINEVDSDTKLHRLETNGETAASPQLFMGAETSSSPILFTGSSGVPPLPPSYMYGAPLPPPFIPPPPHSGGGPMYDISRRPPPLGGRLSSPPPIPPLHHPSGRYEDASSPPPPLSPPLHLPYNHRSPPPFSNERIHPHPPPPFLPPLGTSHSWGDEPLPPLRNPVFHPHQREQRVRNHKGSLHSSGDSLDKTNHTGKS